MAPPEHTQLVLRMFQERHVKPGRMLPYQVLLGGFVGEGLSGSDLDAAIQALQRERIVSQQRLTEPVFLTAPPGQTPARGKREHVIKGFFGTYTVVRQIGEGAAGTVFLVTDENQREHALKRLDPRKASSDRITRFKNEVHFCRQTKHPRIVEITDHGSTDDFLFYVMPYYPATLRTRLNARLPPDQALRLFHEILDGVEAAHLKGVWHRDLKPENILVTADNHLVIADFGIAHIAEELLASTIKTQPDDRLANFRYAAPEQRSSKPTSRCTDIYALGLILHELFTGTVIAGTGYARIAESLPAYAYLDPVVDRMLQHDPKNRHQSIDDVKKDLIGRGDEHAIRQRLSVFQQAIIPENDPDDPLLSDPIRTIKRDFGNGYIKLTLNREPTNEWLKAWPGDGYKFSGIGPENVRFVHATVFIPAGEYHSAERFQLFAEWLQSTNTAYARQRRADHHRALADERERLKNKQALEQERLRIVERLNKLP